MQKATITVGMLLRRQFRRSLQQAGLVFTEDQGWLDSQFVVTGPSDAIYRLMSFVRTIEAS